VGIVGEGGGGRGGGEWGGGGEGVTKSDLGMWEVGPRGVRHFDVTELLKSVSISRSAPGLRIE